MKNLESKGNTYKSPDYRVVPLVWILTFILPILFISCDETEKAVRPDVLNATAVEHGRKSPASFPHSGNLVEVKTEHMNFIMPDEIPSGWNTFRYHNESHMTHLILFEKMPVFDGKQIGLEEYEEGIVPVFQDAMDLINKGMPQEGFAEFANLPAWSSQVIYTGGVGLVSPGETAQSTLKLDPGVYVMECYVKTNGIFHSVNGMAKQFTVMENTADASAPKKPTLNITLTKERGMEIEGKLRPGLHTIAVHFEDQGPHEHALGHDVHLVKLEENTNLEELETWMNWANPKGLETPAPAVFLGGAQEMPAGNTAYFTVKLKPGRYAFISEVPAPAAKGMLHTFTVPQGKETVSRKK